MRIDESRAEWSPRNTSLAALVCINPERVRCVWPVVEPRLQHAVLRTGLCTFAAIEREVLIGHALLWLALSGREEDLTIDAVATTRLELTDAGKVCVITACEGREMARWLPLIRGIEDYAEAEGCRCVRIFGRKGWLRVLDGYMQTHVVIDKALD